LLSHIDSGELKAECVCLCGAKEDSGAAQIAKLHGIPLATEAELASYRPQLICLAGYMRMLSPALLSQYPGRVLNIHPSLLPAFGGKGCYGMRVHQKVLEAGVKVTGVTVHFVDEVYDNGKIIAQEPVRVLDGDTPETLAERVLQTEHDLYWRVVASFI
jgi:formyltetrahydrofolate-dependent phosphoribosylglycinamide formyltransferase